MRVSLRCVFSSVTCRLRGQGTESPPLQIRTIASPHPNQESGSEWVLNNSTRRAILRRSLKLVSGSTQERQKERKLRETLETELRQKDQLLHDLMTKHAQVTPPKRHSSRSCIQYRFQHVRRQLYVTVNFTSKGCGLPDFSFP